MNILPNAKVGWNYKLFWAKFSKVSILWVGSGNNIAIFPCLLDQINLKLGTFRLVRSGRIFTHACIDDGLLSPRMTRPGNDTDSGDFPRRQLQIYSALESS